MQVSNSGAGESSGLPQGNPRAKSEPDLDVSPSTLACMETSKGRRDGLYLMLLGTVMFLLIGAILVALKPDPVNDFKTAYYRGQCLLQHCDPYSETDIESLYARSHELLPLQGHERLVITRDIYLPTEFPFLAPIASLPFPVAESAGSLR